MKISKENENQMELNDNNFTNYIAGGAFIIFGFFLFFSQSPFYYGIIAIAIGTGILLINKSTKVIIDKSTGKIGIMKKTLLKNDIQEYAINTIVSIKVQTDYSSNGKNFHYRLDFITKDNSQIPLVSKNISTENRSINVDSLPEIGVGRSISTFLNIPFRDYRPKTAGEVIGDAVGKAFYSGMNKMTDKLMNKIPEDQKQQIQDELKKEAEQNTKNE